MEKSRLNEAVELLKKYVSENCEAGLSELADAEVLSEDLTALDRMTDAVIALICKIGVDENFQPNIHGVLLDGCLETLNELRQERINRS